MRIEVTYGVSRIAHAGRFCCVRCCLFQAASIQLFRFFPLPFPPSLVDSVSIGLVSISTDLVSVTCLVGGGRSQSCRGGLCALLMDCGSSLVFRPRIAAHFGRHHLQARPLAMSLNHVYWYLLTTSLSQLKACIETHLNLM